MFVYNAIYISPYIVVFTVSGGVCQRKFPTYAKVIQRKAGMDVRAAQRLFAVLKHTTLKCPYETNNVIFQTL